MSEEKNEVVTEKQKNKKAKKNRNIWSKIKRSFQTGQFKSGAYSSILTVLVIAIVVVVNLVFSKLDLTTDLSSGSLFTLTSDTKKVVKKLEQDITIYYMVEDGEEEDYIYNVLKQYEKQSKKITLKKVDPVVNPNFASNHNVDSEVSSNDVIVENEKTSSVKYISADDMYYTNSSYYSSSSSSATLDTEGQVTAAIQSVVSGKKTKMYQLTKHSEQELGSKLTEALEKMDVEIEDLELASQSEVPDDCDILLINGPATDLTDDETTMVLDYLKAGGTAMINAGYSEEELPNVEEILEYYGVSLTNGVVFETTGNYVTYPNCVLPIVNSEYSALSDLEGYVVFPNAAGLTAADSDSLRSSVTITDIMDSSDSAYLKTDLSSETINKEDGDVDGPVSMGLAVTETLDDDKETNLVVFSAPQAFTEQFTSTSQLSNASVFNKTISTLLPSDDTEKVSIDAKDLSYSYISVTPALQLFWAAVMIIVLPLGLLITGFGIWFVRRRK